MSVDFPSPVWPANTACQRHRKADVKKTRTDGNDIELESSLEQLVLNLLRNRVKADVGLGADFFSHGSKN